MDKDQLRRGLRRNTGGNIARLSGMHLIPQKELAGQIGLSRQGINNLIKGRSQASGNTLGVVAHHFGITIDDLLAEPQECLRAAVEAFESAPARAFSRADETYTE